MKRLILVIDDDALLRLGLAKGLRSAGFEVITAESAENAIEVLARIKPDAVVLDRMMNGLDGLTFLKNLRAEGNEIPVIMLTAMNGPENAIDGLSGGANDYLSKPFQLKELVLRVENMMKNRSVNEPRLPECLKFVDGEFFVNGKILGLSGEEKNLMTGLVSPVGNTVPALAMTAKRLRNKIKDVNCGLDLVTVRGRGYRLVSSN